VKIIEIKDTSAAAALFRKIGVEAYGIDAMAPKAVHLNILLEKQSCKVANIIKQEMLSLGGEAAVARGSVACSIPSTDILIMGTIKQIRALTAKMEKQPFGLKLLARDILDLLENIGEREFVLKTSRREMVLSKKTLIMGILNVTPDSFSDGGIYFSRDQAIEHGLRLADEGADMIDIGGESTRPGSKAVPVKVEMERVLPVIEGLSGRIKIPISIDTRKADVAKAAVNAGAEMINDISALNHDSKMVEVARQTGAALVLMHMKGQPRSMQKGNLEYRDLMGEITEYLKKSIDKALNAGVKRESIMVDPGIGFGKTAEDNYKIIKNLSQIKKLGMPVLIGTSRKSFIGKMIGGDPDERMEGTAATVAAAILNGCHVIRVHDVAAMKKVASVTDAVIHSGQVMS
jgi:dihydropteroate synthase